MAQQDFTPYQQKIIKRYYNNQDTIQLQRLAELVTELYLAEGKKKQRVWASVATAMQKLGVPQSRIDHLLKQGNPAQVAEVVKELQAKG
jgi:RNA polymerase-interacting CarD/CdnL/TRCF family regulator